MHSYFAEQIDRQSQFAPYTSKSAQSTSIFPRATCFNWTKFRLAALSISTTYPNWALELTLVRDLGALSLHREVFSLDTRMDDQIKSAQLNIRDLVSQVKSGELDKTAAFDNLQSILRANTGQANGGPEAADGIMGGEGDDGEDQMSQNTGKISQEDRRMLINKLIEKKRQSRSDGDDMGEGGGYDGDAFGAQAYNDSDDVQYDGAEYYQTEASWGQATPSYFTRNSGQDMNYGGHDARSNRIAQTEAAIRHEMFKDCTFRPKIKDLPAYYGARKEDDTSFNDRVTKWQRDKTVEIEQRKSLTADQELEECTFKPKLNRNSLRAVKEIRGEEEAIEHPSERLYKNHELSILQRTKFIEEELSRERELEVKECTFRPNLRKDATYSQVKAKVSAKPKTKKEPLVDPKKYTFAPHVKGITKGMVNAEQYVSTNVVDRLTRPLVSPPEGADTQETFDKPAIDMETFMSNNSNNKTPAAKSRPGSAPATGASTGKKQMKKKEIDNFLGRMEQCEARREQRITQTSKSVTPKFQPKLCKRSIELSTRNTKGEFLERVERDVLRRNDHELRAAVAQDEKCTFKPQLTTKSDKQRTRTVFEMSRGDMLKRDTTNRMMRLRNDQEELAEMTFKPEITTKAKKIGDSTAKVSIKDTNKFLEAAREKQQRKDGERLAVLERKEQDEFEACTFAPQTKECPAYVRRIAKSMAVVRAARSQETESVPSRATWK